MTPRLTYLAAQGDPHASLLLLRHQRRRNELLLPCADVEGWGERRGCGDGYGHQDGDTYGGGRGCGGQGRDGCGDDGNGNTDDGIAGGWGDSHSGFGFGFGNGTGSGLGW